MTELEKRVEWLEMQMRLVHKTLDKIDRKDEPFDKDINVRSKEEPYIDIETGILHWCGWKYKRIYETEPQTIAEDINRRVEMGKKEWNARHIEDEPQTDCAWKEPK